MRFMTMHKADAATEAGTLPTPEAMAAMGSLMDDMANAGILESGEGLRPSSTGVRLDFSAGKRTITPGPYKGTGVIAGFCMVRTHSLEEAIDWATRYAGIVGDAEIDIRPVCEIWDLGFGQKPAGDKTTRFMLTHKADARSEAGTPYPPEVDAGMKQLVADMIADGVFIQSEGLESSTKAKRLHYTGNKRTITDGPFAESKELIAGYGIIDVKSVDEAIYWSDRFAKVVGDVEIDIRRLW